MGKIKPLAKKKPLRRWLRRLFGIKPIPQLATLDEMHMARHKWYYNRSTMRYAPVTCVLRCSVCNVHISRIAGVNYHYCPNCGARMEDVFAVDPRSDGLTIAQTIIDEIP